MTTTNIKTKVHELVGAWMEKLYSGKSFTDLMQIYGDIRVALSQKSPDNESLIDTYTELMAREQLLYSPEAAYQSGSEAAQDSRKYYPMEYINRIGLEPSNQSFLRVRDNLYHSLCDLLGDSYLMDEYNEKYRYCHGAIGWEIEQFYYWGYYGKLPDKKEKAG